MIVRGEFYVYEHWRPDTGLPFYVGKGKGKRGFHFRRRGRSHASICKRLQKLGLNVEVRIVFSGLDEAMAFALEVSQITHWRSHDIALLNKSLGGEGPSGYRHTPEQIANSIAARSTLEHKTLMAAITKEVMARPGVKEQRSRKLKQTLALPAVKAMRIAVQTAFWNSPEGKALRSAYLKEMWAKPGQREARAASQAIAQNRPNVQAKRKASIRAAMAQPATRARQSAGVFALWQNPEFRAKQAAAWVRRKARKQAQQEE